MISILVALAVGGVAGFVSGFLVFRKHQTKINQVEEDGRDIVEDIKDLKD